MTKMQPVVLHQISNLSSGLGNSILAITIPWLILERTGSPTFAGLVAAVSTLPAIFVSPIGGELAEREGFEPSMGLLPNRISNWTQKRDRRDS